MAIVSLCRLVCVGCTAKLQFDAKHNSLFSDLFTFEV